MLRFYSMSFRPTDVPSTDVVRLITIAELFRDIVFYIYYILYQYNQEFKTNYEVRSLELSAFQYCTKMNIIVDICT